MTADEFVEHQIDTLAASDRRRVNVDRSILSMILHAAIAFERERCAEVFRALENYYGCMAEGANEPEFSFYLRCESQMRRERLRLENPDRSAAIRRGAP